MRDSIGGSYRNAWVGIALAFAIAIFVGGCRPSVPTPPTPDSSIASPESPQNSLGNAPESIEIPESTKSGVSSSTHETMEETTSPDKRGKGDDGGLANWTLQELQAGDQEGEWSWERWGFWADGGPYLMDMVHRIGEGSVEREQTRIGEFLLAQLFADEERVTWDAVWEQPLIAKGFFANQKPESPALRTQLQKRYDVNEDGLLGPRELVSLVTRGRIDRRQLQVGEDPARQIQASMFDFLDSDGDRKLSLAEEEVAPLRLFRLDLNGDYLVSRNEMAMSENRSMLDGMRSLQLSSRLVAKRWDERGRGQEVVEYFGKRFGIARETWLWATDDFDRLDRDQDGSLTPTEAKELWSLESRRGLEFSWPQLEWNAGRARPIGKSFEVSRRGHSEAGKERWVEQERALTWEAKGIVVRWTFIDRLGEDRVQKRLQELADGMGISAVRSAAIVEGLGGPEARFSPSGLDRDQDGRLDWSELEWGVSVKAILSSCLPRIRVTEFQEGWFSWLDQNGDGVLSESEIRDSRLRLGQLRELHSASDSDLAPESLPAQLHVYVVRSFLEDDPFPDNVLSEAQNKLGDHAIPLWLSAMDINGDGAVTPREFLGTNADFQSLDLDANGRLESQDFRGADAERKP